ncbi:MAG TPA: hypothetical protein VGU71_09070 [Candidatus Dormibacteraeota bacterium]|nr:hypothetical protein [Candidatus Dormibacteraeota bacterium]
MLVMQGTSLPLLADVTDAAHPLTICSFAGAWQPQLVTQTMVSWYASQGPPGAPSTSAIVTLDVFSGISALVATWTGNGFMDGLYAWSPDQSLLAYITSDASAVNLHLLSGGGDRVVASLGPVPGRGVSPTEDDAYLGFSADGGSFALEQTFTSAGDRLQVRRAYDGGLAYSQASSTMATWGSSGSRLYFRQPLGTQISVWDSTSGVSTAFGQSLAWIKPRADAGDDYLAFSVRDSSGTPHVWLYGHGGRAGGMLVGVRASPVFLNTTTLFYVEEASCSPNCGPGPATQPDGRTFTYDIGRGVESPSSIASVLGSWPRPGQI